MNISKQGLLAVFGFVFIGFYFVMISVVAPLGRLFDVSQKLVQGEHLELASDIKTAKGAFSILLLLISVTKWFGIIVITGSIFLLVKNFISNRKFGQ